MNQYVKFGAISAMVLLAILSAIVMTDEVQAADENEIQTEVIYYVTNDIGEGNFPTFDAAYESLKEIGGTIVLEKGASINDDYWTNKCDLTIKLNGYTLTLNLTLTG